MIDNFDSFTYNLVQYFQILGAEVVVKRNNALSLSDVRKINPDCVVISPGPCSPKESGISIPLVREFFRTYPILGVCLGHQVLGEVFGGSIVSAPTLMHGKTSLIYHKGHLLFDGLPNPFEATRYHSLMVDPKSLSRDFEVFAWSDDRVIMGIAHNDLPLIGVQFHPESILTKGGIEILKNFLKLVSTRNP